MENKAWIVYIIRCFDKSLYCGITNDLQSKLAAHNSGKGAKYTRSRRPVELVAASPKMSKSDALKFEYRVKQLPSGKKIIELIKRKEEATMDLKKQLQAVNKEIKALTKMVEKLIAVTGKVEKSKPKTAKAKAVKKAPGKKPAAKPKTAKKAPAKKPAIKSKVVKKASVKKSAIKKIGKMSAIETVLAIINGSEMGVDTAALIKETGFNAKKIQNNVFKLKKQGKIKAGKKGVYVKV